MNSNARKFICVDRECQLSNKIIDNWDCLLEHQQLNHKMLAINQLHEALLKIQKNQQSPQNMQSIENEIKAHEDQIVQTVKIIEEDYISMIQNRFKDLTQQITQEFRQQILSIQIGSQLSLDGFYEKIDQWPYYNTAIKQYQEQNSMNWINIEADKFQKVKEKQFTDYYPQFEQFLKSIFKTDQERQMNQSSSNIQSKLSGDLFQKNDWITLQPGSFPQQQSINNSFQQTSQNLLDLSSNNDEANIPPLKNYRMNMKSETEKSEQSLPTYLQIQNLPSSILYSNKYPQFCELPKDFAQRIQQIKLKQSNSESTLQVDIGDQICFDLSNFCYLDEDDAFQFSSTCIIGPLQLVKQNQGVITDGEGMILFEGFINQNIIQYVELRIISRSKNFYVEIGVIDWNKFKYSKKRTAQKGVYSYNNHGEIFDDGETKQRQPMIQHDANLLITYNNECENLIYQVQQNQAICLRKIKNKSKLTFFAKLYKAQLQIIE